MAARRGRDRSLSVNRASDEQRATMDASLDNLHAILSEVQYDWRIVTEKNPNPLEIALPLLDNTSVGMAHKHGDFLQLKDRISNGLKSAVNAHYQAFNDSIGSYRSVVQNIVHSQNTILRIRDTVNTSTDNLQNDEESLSSLNDHLKLYDDMIILLGAIEETKQAPADLENAIREKNYSKAQSILHSVFQKGDTHKLWELPALSNLYDYFKTQEGQLFEILVEELHSIIYSKKVFASFNSATEFFRQSTSTQYSNIEKFLINTIDTDLSATASASNSRVEDFMKSFTSATELLDSKLGDESDFSELSAIDDTNPFNQINHILQIIHNLGKLATTIEIIIQRTTTELSQMINRIIEDTKLKHSKVIKSLNSGNGASNIIRRLNDDAYSSVVLQDLFWKFFTKLLFFEQTIFVITQINKRLEANNPDALHLSITSSDTVSDSILDVSRLGNLLRHEVKSLILTYISTDETSALGTKLTNSVSFSKNDTKPNALFQFYHVDYDKDHTTEMKTVLQDLFPGFINFNDMSKIDSPYIEDNKFTKQSKLIPANILNMRHILEPFLLFIQGSSLLVPRKEEAAFKFFNDFMNHEFLPLLEESFISLYIDEVEETDPLVVYESVPDYSSYETKISDDKPIFKIFVDFKNFLNDVCFILNTSLQFRNEFSSIIFKLLTKFQEKISEVHEDLFNEIISYLEPNKDVIQNLRNPAKTIQSSSTENINKTELRNSKIYSNYQILRESLEFILTLLETKLIKEVDLNKTDLNMTTIEKLRKNWSFFEVINIKSDVFSEHEDLGMEHVNKVILNDELKAKYDVIVGDYKNLRSSVSTVLDKLDSILQIS